jgi:formate-dependent nitrite reductase membrane component NrfD
MKEELIVSGRMNPGIDPVLHVWGWEIAVYLFLGGLAAGLLIFASFNSLRRGHKKYPTAISIAPLIVPFLLIFGLLALFIDLRHKLYFWQLYTTIRLQSPMSWGAWTLMAVTPSSVVWACVHLKKVFPIINFESKTAKILRIFILPAKEGHGHIANWHWKYHWMNRIENWFFANMRVLSWLMLIYAVLLGIYTGILLSAFNARPLWNTSILGPLFLTSGLSAAAATIILMSKNHEERRVFSVIDIVMIGIEIFLIIHMFMGFLASTQVQIMAAQLFLGGQYTIIFWIFVVFLGLILPGFLEILELNGYKIPVVIPAILVLVGGLILRFVIVYAGQVSRYLY